MRRLICLLGLAAMAQLSPINAQLSTNPNEDGVVMGHIHLHVRNVEAEKKFWSTLGGVAGNKVSVQEAFRFPGALILIRPKLQANGKEWPDAIPTGGSEGSVIGHIGFRVPDAQASMAKWKAAGLNTKPGSRPQQVYVFDDDQLKVEILEDKSLTVPIVFDHIHFYVAADAVPEIEAWYVKQFSAKVADLPNAKLANVPGAALRFTASPTPTAPTRGRVVDHIGFEITHLDAFAKKLEANGVKVDEPYRSATGPGTFGAIRLYDPWGTYMELTEGERQY